MCVEFKKKRNVLERRLSFGEHVPIAIKRYRDVFDFLYEKVKSKW